MFKKSLVIWSALLVFTWCATVKNETPEQVLLQNQTQLIESIEKYSYPVEMWEVETNALVEIKSKEGDISVKSISKFDFDKLKNAFSWDISADVSIVSPAASGSWKISLSTMLSEKIFYLKLNDFDISIPWQEWVEFAKMMVAQYIWKWINLDLSKEDLNLPASLLSFDDLTSVYKEYEVLKSIKVNEDEDFYNYGISLNEENIIKIAEELLAIEDPETKLTQEQLDDIKKQLSDMKFSWNVKVEPKNKSYFIFSWSIEDVSINITNNKEIFKAVFSSEWSEISFDFKKTTKWATWTIILVEWWKEELKSNLEFEVSSTSFNILWDFTFDWATSTIDIKNTFKSKKSVEIKTPEGSTTLEELIWGFMWAAMGWANIGNVIEWEPLDKPLEQASDNELNINVDELNEIWTNEEELEKALNSDEVKEAMDEIEWLSDLEWLEDLLK